MPGTAVPVCSRTGTYQSTNHAHQKCSIHMYMVYQCTRYKCSITKPLACAAVQNTYNSIGVILQVQFCIFLWRKSQQVPPKAERAFLCIHDCPSKCLPSTSCHQVLLRIDRWKRRDKVCSFVGVTIADDYNTWPKPAVQGTSEAVPGSGTSYVMGTGPSLHSSTYMYWSRTYKFLRQRNQYLPAVVPSRYTIQACQVPLVLKQNTIMFLWEENVTKVIA